MKIAVIGGASVRTPLLVNGLFQSDLPIEEVALFDIDQERLSIIGALAGSYAPAVRPYADASACVAGAAFVILSIRAGGTEARARDEAIALAHGIAGQETTGPAGFAMAMRAAPRAIEYGELVARVAPRAWLINFTNPVGIVTQAIADGSDTRVIGICDTPTELFEEAAHALDLPVSRCFFDYFGLNHLGWLRDVIYNGTRHLSRIWDRPECLARVYRTKLFEPEFLRELRLLPTEYLYFYYSPRAAFENTRRAGKTRGQAIAALNAQLFTDLAGSPARAQAVYEAYLDARSAGYMQIESGGAKPPRSTASGERGELSGYDRIAVGVIRAIHFNTNAVIPLNVRNRGSIPVLQDEDVVEVPCVVNANGAHPLAVGGVPAAVRGLLERVKQYERLTVRAAAAESADHAVAALTANPLVPSREAAASLVQAFLPW